MNRGYDNLFIGFMLVIVDVNVGSFDIIPDVLGYFLIIIALSQLYTDTKIPLFNWLAYIASVMSLLSVVEVFIRFSTFDTISVHISYIFMMIGVLVDTLLITGLYQGMSAHMALEKEEALALKFSAESRLILIIQGICAMYMSFTINLPPDQFQLVGIGIIAVSFIMHVKWILNLHRVKKVFIVGYQEENEVV